MLLSKGVPVLLILACLPPAVAVGAGGPAAASGTSPAVGPQATLEIVGKGVESLVLVDRAGRQRDLNRPGSSVSVPPGEYYPEQVVLQGGFSARGWSFDQSMWFILAPGRPHRLEVGAPLTPTVTVKRRGSVLKLDYALVDASGRKYSPSDRKDPPWFKVYQGDRQIGAGSFEYG